MLRVVNEPNINEWAGLTTRPTRPMDETIERVRPILDAVRIEGDSAVRRFTTAFDGVDIEGLAVSAEEIAAASDLVPDELKAAIRTAIRNIETFHRAQWEPVRRISTMPGVSCWRRSLAIERVGLYVPGGTAPLFSTVLMLGIPARIAGCREVVLCTPPGPGGRVDPAILFSAQETGISQVFRVGGAQAIAAMTYGTRSIPKVDKLFGPGNQYVTAAKQLASAGGTAVDMPAGPTELAVLADETADVRFVAADLLSQAEHGVDSQVVLVTTDATLPGRLAPVLEAALETLPRRDVARQALANSLCVTFRHLDDALTFVNAYAAEHLVLAVRDAARVAGEITHAGSVFVGAYAPESVGDYASGTNHTLPTGGAARAFSGVSLDSFVRKVTFQELTTDGLRHLGPSVEAMARAEGLEGHARAVSVRLEAIGRLPQVRHRVAETVRTTKETDIRVRIDLDGTGATRISTGLAFFDHMLEQIGRHGGFDLEIDVRGDLHVDEHHTVEDTAIALGACLRDALGDKRGIGRYGFLLPMDDALAQVALDLGGRSWLEWDVTFTRDRVGDVPTELWSHFFKSFCDGAAANLNVRAEGENDHHRIEAIFKAVARALRQAVAVETGREGILPSTKGTL